MKILELIRLEESEDGTLGVLKINKQIFCYTLEPQDRLNKPNESSIPAQQYLCHRWTRSNDEQTWIVVDVPDRHGIMFHAGNTASDTAGCILLGDTIGKLRNDRAVLNSGKTFQRFMELTQDEAWLHLTILQVY